MAAWPLAAALNNELDYVKTRELEVASSKPAEILVGPERKHGNDGDGIEGDSGAPSSSYPGPCLSIA